MRKGKATSRAPICSGTTKFIRPVTKRHGHEEDHDDAVGGEHLVVVVRRQVALVEPKATACWARIMSASEKPRTSITSASTQYMMPIFLWSMLVNQSVHR